MYIAEKAKLEYQNVYQLPKGRQLGKSPVQTIELEMELVSQTASLEDHAVQVESKPYRQVRMKLF